jgi:hypothetical protein
MHLCSKYLETFTRVKENEKGFAELSIDLLVNMREIIMIDRAVCLFFSSFKDGCAPSTYVFWYFSSNHSFQFHLFFTIIFLQYYQNLFRDGECFLHVVSLLNGTFNEAVGEHLVLNILQTLTALLAENDESKVTKYLATVHACLTKTGVGQYLEGWYYHFGYSW